eukprot:3644326-Pleurochrysis_carterae.AAC.1
MHYFDEGNARARRKGKVNVKAERRDNAAVLAAIAMREAVREEARTDLAQQHKYVEMKREHVSTRQFEKLVAEYTKAMGVHPVQGARDADD